MQDSNVQGFAGSVIASATSVVSVIASNANSVVTSAASPGGGEASLAAIFPQGRLLGMAAWSEM